MAQDIFLKILLFNIDAAVIVSYNTDLSLNTKKELQSWTKVLGTVIA